MAKWNHKPKNQSRVLNAEGGESYKPTMKLELMLRTMSFLMSVDAYYQKEETNRTEIQNLIKNVSSKDPGFVLKLAVYARQKMYLRSVPVYLLVEYAKLGLSSPGAYRYVPEIIRRADEPQEALAYLFGSSQIKEGVEEKRKEFLERTGKKYVPRTSVPVPHMLRKGLSLALNNFDSYQFSKYDRESEVREKDTVFLSHPRPVSESNQKNFDDIVAGTLDTPYTWETELSAKGNTKEVWDELLSSGRLPFMALLRNLRNIVQSGANIKPAYDIITDPKLVMKSKQFPYRFFSAYRELQSTQSSRVPEVSKLMDAVEIAMGLSADNIEIIPGTTAVFSDNSGSMHGVGPSEKSKVLNIDIASLFSAIALRKCERAIVGVFGNDYSDVNLSSRSSIMDNMRQIRDTDVGHATEAWKAIASIGKRKIFVDRIFIFSDMQCYTEYPGSHNDMRDALNRYRREVNPQCRVYSFDVSSHGLLKFPEKDPLTCPIAGYSDQVFRFVKMFESDKTTMLKDIESMEPEK